MSDVPESEFPFRAGHVVGGRYRIVRALNAGGIGVVYEAEHTFNGLRVALKALYNRAGDHAARMHGEARTLAELRHPNIVQVTDGGITGAKEDGGEGIVWFTMELLVGATLREVLAECGSLPIDRALRFGIQLARGVAQAHARGVLHRDIKPENIFVLDDGDQIKVLDFGISKLNEATRRSSGLKTTDKMRILGTEAYVAPEALRADKLGPPADIYSTGHVLYEMMAGIHCWSEGPGPLDFPPKHELGTRQIFAPPTPLAERAPGTPAYVDRVVMRALEKTPGARQQTMEELAAELEHALETYSKQPRPVSPPAREAPRHTVRLETKTEEIPAVDAAMEAEVRASGPVAISSSHSGVSLDNALLCGAARFVSSSAVLSPVERGMRVLAEVEARVPQFRGMLRMLARMALGADDRMRTSFVNALRSCGAGDATVRVQTIQAIAKRLVDAGFRANATSEIRGHVLALGAGQLIEAADRLDSAESAIQRLVERDEDVQNFACSIFVALARTAAETHPAPRGALLALLLGSAEDSELARRELADFVLSAAPSNDVADIDEASVAQLRTSAAELEVQIAKRVVSSPPQQNNSVVTRNSQAGMTPTPASMTTPADPIARNRGSVKTGTGLRGLVMTFAIAGVAATFVGLIALVLRPKAEPERTTTSPAGSEVIAPLTATTASTAPVASITPDPAPSVVISATPERDEAHAPPPASAEPRRPATPAKPAAASGPGVVKSKLPASGLDETPAAKKGAGVAF